MAVIVLEASGNAQKEGTRRGYSRVGGIGTGSNCKAVCPAVSKASLFLIREVEDIIETKTSPPVTGRFII